MARSEEETALDVELPHDRWIWGTIGACAAVALAGVALVASGHPVAGAICIVVGVGVLVALWAVGRKVTSVLMAGPAALFGGQAAEESFSDEAQDQLAASAGNLPEEDRERLLANTRAQTADTKVWFEAHESQIEDVRIVTEDGYAQVGHVLEAHPGSKRWLVYAHGFGGSWKNGLGYGRHFEEQGYNVLFLEMRAQGQSEGAVVGAGWLERRDLVAWARWLVGRAGDDAQIVLFGSSMGAASVTMASAEPDLPAQVRVTVCDSGYAGFWDMMASLMRQVKIKGVGIPVHPLLDAVRFVFMHTKGGYDFGDATPARAIARSRVPVMIVQGMGDQLVGPTNGARLAKAAGGAAAGEGHDLLEMPGAGHCCSAMADPERYYERVFAFVGHWA